MLRRNIEQAKALIEKYTRDLNEVKNNREYDSLNKEIEYEDLEVELAEKKLRENAKKEGIAAEEIEKIREVIDDKKLTLEDKRGELDEIISETRQKEEELRDTAKKKEMLIEPRLLMAYKRIRKAARNGLGVVCVERDACGGCFNKIPPQRQLDIKMSKKVIVCEYCGRIIVDPELVGVKVEKKAEAAPKKRTICRLKKTEAAPEVKNEEEA